MKNLHFTHCHWCGEPLPKDCREGRREVSLRNIDEPDVRPLVVRAGRRTCSPQCSDLRRRAMLTAYNRGTPLNPLKPVPEKWKREVK